jgi:voltage-gated potassium channel
MSIQQVLWRQLAPEAYDKNGLSPINKIVVCIVIVSTFLAIVETEPTIESRAPVIFAQIERVLALTFAIEYLVRLWAEGQNPKFAGFFGRIRYALTPAALIDLAAFLPSLIAPAIGNAMLLRIFRLLRILRLARLGKFSVAMRHMIEAVSERREELLLSLMLAGIILVFSAASMYVLEGEDYPVAFGSIPRALWWSVCTLTTVGYGDIYPHSVLGKVCGALTSVAGIGLIAMPTGILAAAFSDAFQRSRAGRPTR